MASDPVRWLTEHWESGVNLRNEGWALRTVGEADAWEERQVQWTNDLYRGVAEHDPGAVGKLRTLNWIAVLPLSEGHPWADDSRNPLNHHNTRLDRVEALIDEWRARPDMRSKPDRKRGRPPHIRSFAERSESWATQIGERPEGTTMRSAAERISAHEGIDPLTVEREARRARNSGEKREK